MQISQLTVLWASCPLDHCWSLNVCTCWDLFVIPVGLVPSVGYAIWNCICYRVYSGLYDIFDIWLRVDAALWHGVHGLLNILFCQLILSLSVLCEVSWTCPKDRIRHYISKLLLLMHDHISPTGWNFNKIKVLMYNPDLSAVELFLWLVMFVPMYFLRTEMRYLPWFCETVVWTEHYVVMKKICTPLNLQWPEKICSSYSAILTQHV